MLSYLDLADTYDFVNYSGGLRHHAYVNRETGEIRRISELEPDLFDAWDDALESPPWAMLPPREELDPLAGKGLALEFAAYFRPRELKPIAEYFRYDGGMTHFMGWLERRGLADKWYPYELAHTEALLRGWCEHEGIALAD